MTGVRISARAGQCAWLWRPRIVSPMGARSIGGGIVVTVNIDEYGQVDWIVVEFPGTKLTGEIAPIIKDYVDRGLIKVLDLVFLKKDEGGSLEAFEASDLGVGEIGELRGYERDLAMVLSSPISPTPRSDASNASRL